MKRKFLILLVLLSVMVFPLGLFACNDTSVSRESIYVVRFDNNYDGDVKKVEVEPNKAVTLVEDPVRTGYIFKGWYTSDSGEEKFDESQLINSNITLFAKWERDTSLSIVTLKYLNYTSLDDTYAVANGTAFAQPTTPKYNDDEIYSFDGWYVDAECTSLYDFTAKVNGDITLYAGWTQQKTYVTFDANYAGCDAATSQVVALNGTVAEPSAAPERSQYEFGGWYTERVGGDVYDFSSPVTQKLSLYAHWKRSDYTIRFNVNGATIPTGTAVSFNIKSGASAEEYASSIESAMVYEGHDFGGWYKVKVDPDSEEDITTAEQVADITDVQDDMVVYAKWTLKEYEISFNYNYEDAPAAPQTQVVKYGKTATSPDATREGYIFLGWFTEAECATQFIFDRGVTASYTLYAKWVENSVSNQDVTVTLYTSQTGSDVVYKTLTVAFGGTAASQQPEDPEITDYYFAGWYEDKDYTTEFSFSKILSSDISVYAKLLKKYTFEAEAVDFTGKTGQGTSTNSVEEGMIMDYTFVAGGNTTTVSNGYFVRELYYNGAYLDFEIDAAEEVFDAVLYLRVSSESYEFVTTKEVDGVKYNYLSDTDFKIIVNGEWDGDTPLTWLNYGGLYMPMANLVDREDLAQNKTPFEDCLIAVNIHLKKGRNVITLYVDNNNNHGGTFHAEAPIIDCMYIYSSTELTTTDYKFYEGEKVNRG
jgi:uncharacterized repeat protein (TIGR02543 family)